MAKWEIEAKMQFEAFETNKGINVMDILAKIMQGDPSHIRGYLNADSDEGYAVRTCGPEMQPDWLFSPGSKTRKVRSPEEGGGNQ